MSRSIRHVLPLIVLTASVGCASAAMQLPADLAGVERMEVEGRGGWRGSQGARFGAWAAEDVERSWTKGSGWRVGIGPVSGGSDRAAQEYSFRFVEEGAELGRVLCETRGSRSSAAGRVVGVDIAAEEALECRPAPADVTVAGAGTGAEPAWDLVLSARRDRHLEGFLRIGQARYPVVSTGPGGGMAPAVPYGFEIRSEGRVVAAVETVNDGAVWLAPELTGETRTTFAAAAAALLLFERVATDE